MMSRPVVVSPVKATLATRFGASKSSSTRALASAFVGTAIPDPTPEAR